MNDVSVMPSEIKIAVIGFGFMGRTHVSAFSGIPRCRIAAVVDREPQRLARGLADTGNIETGATSFDFDHESVEVFESVERLLGGFEFDLILTRFQSNPGELILADRSRSDLMAVRSAE